MFKAIVPEIICSHLSYFSQIKVIIDTDGGIDDINALILALGYAQGKTLIILGITTVDGVAGSINHTVINVYRALRLFEKQRMVSTMHHCQFINDIQ